MRGWTNGPIGGVHGSSQTVGSTQPQHVVIAGSDWTQSHAPAANTKATCTQAAAADGRRNVCTALTIALAGGASAPAAVNVTVRLIDGLTGGTAYLWQLTISLPAVAGSMNGAVRGPIWIVGSPNTPMTLEFSAAGGANTIESVSMEGTAVDA